MSGPIDCILPALYLDRPFTVNILPRAGATETASNLREDAVSVFTERSKDDTGSSAGFAVWSGSSPLGSGSFSLGSSPSVFKCEVFCYFEDLRDHSLSRLCPIFGIHF